MSVQLLDEYWPVARKEHQCSVCGGVIGRGDKYRYQRLKDDDLYVLKTHRLCDAAYWRAFRESGLLEDEGLEWSEVRPLVAGVFAALAGA